MSTVATDVEEKSGTRWELTEKTVYALISKEVKMKWRGGGVSGPAYLRGHYAEMSHKSWHRHDVDKEWPNQIV